MQYSGVVRSWKTWKNNGIACMWFNYQRNLYLLNNVCADRSVNLINSDSTWTSTQLKRPEPVRHKTKPHWPSLIVPIDIFTKVFVMFTLKSSRVPCHKHLPQKAQKGLRHSMVKYTKAENVF